MSNGMKGREIGIAGIGRQRNRNRNDHPRNESDYFGYVMIRSENQYWRMEKITRSTI